MKMLMSITSVVVVLVSIAIASPTGALTGDATLNCFALVTATSVSRADPLTNGARPVYCAIVLPPPVRFANAKLRGIGAKLEAG